MLSVIEHSLSFDLQEREVKTTQVQQSLQLKLSPVHSLRYIVSQDSEEQEAKDSEGLIPCEKSYPACAERGLLEFT